MPTPAPERIWAFHSPHLADTEEGATIIAYEERQRFSHEYVRADLMSDALIEAERRGVERMQTRSIKLLEALAETVRSLSDRPDVDAGRAEHLALSLLDAAETIRALPLTEETPDDA